MENSDQSKVNPPLTRRLSLFDQSRGITPMSDNDSTEKFEVKLSNVNIPLDYTSKLHKEYNYFVKNMRELQTMQSDLEQQICDFKNTPDWELFTDEQMQFLNSFPNFDDYLLKVELFYQKCLIKLDQEKRMYK